MHYGRAQNQMKLAGTLHGARVAQDGIFECSVMATKHLGDTIDIHGGGQDLAFPHHENEIAQSESKTGKKFANYWMHNAFVTMGEEKMSKSL